MTTTSSFAIDMYSGGTVDIECFGDSTQFGVDPLNSPSFVAALPAPAKLQGFLREYYNNSNITVTNRGVSGSRSSQMLDGTDGSCSTFAAKMAVSTANIVYCNHGINDCQNVPPTAPDDYRANLLSFVSICRDNGKIPILETPNPVFAVPTLGTTAKANRLKAYVQIMKDVAEETHTVLIDLYTMVDSFIRSGDYRVLDAVPDGVHPSQAVYLAIGQLLAQPFVHPQPGLAMSNQFISVAEGTMNITPANATILAEATRTGIQQVSDAIDHAKSLRMLVRVDEPGLDVWMSYPIWGGGLASVGVAFDQATVGTINQLSAVGLTGYEYVQDHEVCIARNVPIGLHMVTLSSLSGAASLGLSYIRVRRTQVKKVFTKGAVASDRCRDLACKSLTLFGGGADAALIMDELPISRFLAADGLDITFAATMAKGTAFILHGVTTAPPASATAMKARMGVGVGCDATTGFVSVYQLSGEATYTTTAVNAADFSSVSRQFRLIIAAGTNNLNVYVAGALLGTVALTAPYLGGFMGAWANGAGKTITIQDIRSIEH